MSVSSLREYYEQNYLPMHLIGSRSGTRWQYEIALHHWESFAALLPLRHINSLVLANFASAFSTGRQPATVNKTLRHLAAIIRAAKTEHYIRHLPAIPHLREPHHIPIAFLKEEFAEILKAATKLKGFSAYDAVPCSLWWRSFLLADWDTGLRAGALLQTLTFDVRLEGIPGFYVKAECQKDWEGGWYAIHTETIEAIRLIYDPARKYLWPFPYGLKVLGKHFRKICELAGIECERKTCCLLHRIRKSHASYVQAAGGNAQWDLGHSSAKVTQGYLDPRITRKSGAMLMPHGF